MKLKYTIQSKMTVTDIGRDTVTVRIDRVDNPTKLIVLRVDESVDLSLKMVMDAPSVVGATTEVLFDA